MFLSLETSYIEGSLVPNFWGSGHQQVGLGQWRALRMLLFVSQPSPCENAALRSALRVRVLFASEHYVLECRWRGT